jgi:predicted O-methyltransferase YrrM
MKFEQVYDLLTRYQRERGGWYAVLGEQALRDIYQHIIATGAKDCLELGTAFGATTCVMAAAVEENGGGTVTTIDHVAREPVGVAQLAQMTGLTHYVRAIELKAGYNWFLLGVLREQTRGDVCEPCYDFCFLDGAHLWEPDALAALLVTRLLRPGGWLLMDDLHFRPRDHPGWETAFTQMSEDEVNTGQVGMVYDLLVKTHPHLGRFTLSNAGHMGWARKLGGPPDPWLPGEVIVGPVTATWSQSCDGAKATGDMGHSDGVSIEARGGVALIRSTGDDPQVLLNMIEPSQPIHYATLRLHLLTPDRNFVQLYWIGADDRFFTEENTTRCLVRSASGMQDLTFRFRGSPEAQSIRALRLDPADGPCTMLLERLTIGSW